MRCLAEMYAVLGDAAAAARARAIYDAAVVDFNALFYVDGGERAHYLDWIDAAGNGRNYYYVDTAFTAIIAGIASPAQATALLGHYDARLLEMYKVYDVLPGGIWSPPGNLYPLNVGDIIAETHPLPAFPSYENGGSFFHSAGLRFAALGAAGRADDAVAELVALLNSGFGEVRGWAQQLYWGVNGTAGSLVGFDPLNTAALALWGALRAGFGVALTLDGVHAISAPAAAFEGAVYNMSVLGESVCLTVRASVARYCNDTPVPAAA